ncbi:cuticle protein-like [Coccinella septempunctata]|uniref:cuticle protein-like n=1 Tax=Coccinella septempunctata TaxID=41139 RepID=UPI001D08B295|nr:cuticle protein-like [Coccinella septempunctata]
MVAKFIVLVACLAFANAGNPQYEFGYDVQDGLTGDSKNQFETRSGDFVRGQYSLNDPDGTRRIVDYVADPINGFNANVRKEPLVAKAVVAAPAIAKVAAAPVLPALRSAAIFSQPAVATTPILRSTLASAPLLNTYAASNVVGSPLLRSYGYGLGSSSLLGANTILSSRLAAPSLGYSSFAPSLRYSAAYSPSIGYSASYAPSLGYSAAFAPSLGYSSGYAPSLGYSASFAPAYGYSGGLGYSGYGKISSPAVGYSTLIH